MRALIQRGRSEPRDSIAVEWQGQCCDGLGNEKERMGEKMEHGKIKKSMNWTQAGFGSSLVWTSFELDQKEDIRVWPEN